MEPDELRRGLCGLMSFPVTPFAADGELDVPRFREHLRHQLATKARVLFVACGTGEMFSLELAEHRKVAEIAVQEVGGAKPVIVGVGYGSRIAREMTANVQKAGADGALILPPYLVNAPQCGLFEHYRSIAESTSIGVIVYQRDNAMLTEDTICRLACIPNVVGLKDASGDTDHLTRVRIATEGQLPLMNGMPTAEITSFSYRSCGVETYSSAVLNFVPEIATRFYDAFATGDTQTADRLLAGFFVPFGELRNQEAGYAVSLIKAGINIRNGHVGDVRPPLMPPSSGHLDRLEQIISDGLDLL